MADRPAAVVLITQFPGLVSDTDELDVLRGSAQVQTNLTSDRPGRLDIRGGFLQVEFEG